MEFDKTRVYTAVNAEELEIGSLIIAALNLEELERAVESGIDTQWLCRIVDKSNSDRFGINIYDDLNNLRYYPLAYLIKPPENPVYKPFSSVDKAMETIKKHGGWVREKKRNAILLVVKIDNDGIATCDDVAWVNYEVFCEEFVFADDGSPCGELVEE